MTKKDRPSEIRLAQATLYRLEYNIIKIVVHEGAVFDVNDMDEVIQARKKMVGDEQYSILTVPEKFSSITAEGRNYASKQEHIKNRVALAIVVHNLAHRIMGNFFIKFHQPNVPARLFTSEKKAMEWLRDQMK